MCEVRQIEGELCAVTTELTKDLFNIKAENAIFIDDNLRNIEAANNLGLNGIQFESPEQLIINLKTFNIIL